MMNTIEYRVDCQLLQYLHWENALGYRFPIGRMDQVEKWQRDEIVGFWQRHYFPANATLYIVGDVDVQVGWSLMLWGAGCCGRSGGNRLRSLHAGTACLAPSAVAWSTRLLFWQHK
jgi:hypothetical protein